MKDLPRNGVPMPSADDLESPAQTGDVFSAGEGEQRYRRLFDLSPDPTFVHDGQRVLQVNEAAARYLGYEVGQLVGRDVLSVLHPESQLRAMGWIAEMLATGNTPRRTELTLVDAHGGRLVAETSSAVVTLGGHPAIITVLRDLTEQRAAERAAAVSEERFRSVVEAAPMGMHLYRLDDGERLVFVGANPAADRILGVPNAEFVGKTIEEAFPALVGTGVPEAYRRVALTGEPWSTEQVNYDEGGIAGAFEVHAFRTSEYNVAVMFLDITERRRVEAERDEYRDLLEKRVRERTEQLTEVRTELDAITSVVVKAVELRDPYTAGHQQRVAQLAVQMARRLGMAEDAVEQVRVAAVLHDIGKLSVPAEILSKPGSLTPAEYELVKGHPQAAYQILSDVQLDWPLSQTVLQHHERMDGSGYPQGLIGEQIHIGARLLAVADVVEAMSSHRPYRPSIGREQALAEITANRGVLYDPAVVDACISAFEDGFSFDQRDPAR